MEGNDAKRKGKVRKEPANEKWRREGMRGRPYQKEREGMR